MQILFQNLGRSTHGAMTLVNRELKQFAIPFSDGLAQVKTARGFGLLNTNTHFTSADTPTSRIFFRTLLHRLKTAQIRVNDVDLDGILVFADTEAA